MLPPHPASPTISSNVSISEEFPISTSSPPLLNTSFLNSINISWALIRQTLFWVLGMHKYTKQIQIPLLLKLLFYGKWSGVDADKREIMSCMVASALWDERAAKGKRVLWQGGQKGPHWEVGLWAKTAKKKGSKAYRDVWEKGIPGNSKVLQVQGREWLVWLK